MHTYGLAMTYPLPFCQGLKALISRVRLPIESEDWDEGGRCWFEKGGRPTGTEEAKEDGGWWQLGTKEESVWSLRLRHVLRDVMQLDFETCKVLAP
jgi:hypothetical protein